MAEKSIFWTTGATGDGATAYTQAEVIRWMRQLLIASNADEGVHKGYQNELEVTGTSSPVQVDTGAAVCYGFPYWNTSAVSVAIPTPSANTRIDRVVLRVNWSAQTTRITRIAGVEGTGNPPSITQTDGVTWDIKLAQCSITTGGVITVTDEREYLHFNSAIDENQIEASVAGDGLAGGDGTPLSVGVDGVTIETSGDQLRVKDAGIDENKLNASVAGSGITGGAGSPLAISPDGSTLELSGDTIRVKDLGITLAKMAANSVDENKIKTSVAGDGLAGGGGAALSVNVDNVTIETSGDALQVKNDGIDDTKAGNRIIQIYRRQGGHVSGWSTIGTTTYTPAAVRMQCGARDAGVIAAGAGVSFTITFPVAFSYAPIIMVSLINLTGPTFINPAFVYATTPTVSGCGVRVEVLAGSGSDNYYVNWVAIGPE